MAQHRLRKVSIQISLVVLADLAASKASEVDSEVKQDPRVIYSNRFSDLHSVEVEEHSDRDQVDRYEVTISSRLSLFPSLRLVKVLRGNCHSPQWSIVNLVMDPD